VGSLLDIHYDPAYRRSMGRHHANIRQHYELADLSVNSLQQLVETLATTSSRLK